MLCHSWLVLQSFDRALEEVFSLQLLCVHAESTPLHSRTSSSTMPLTFSPLCFSWGRSKAAGAFSSNFCPGRARVTDMLCRFLHVRGLHSPSKSVENQRKGLCCCAPLRFEQTKSKQNFKNKSLFNLPMSPVYGENVNWPLVIGWTRWTFVQIFR